MAVNTLLPVLKSVPPLFTEADGLYYRLSDLTGAPPYSKVPIKFIITLNHVDSKESRAYPASVEDVSKELLPVTMGISFRPDAVKLQFAQALVEGAKRYSFDFGTDMSLFAGLVEDVILTG